MKIIKFDKTVMTGEEARGAVDGTIIKTIVLKTTNGYIAVILPIEHRLDLNKLKSLGVVRLAKAREVERATGYKIGGVPPLGLPIPTYVDNSVPSAGELYGGGGDERSLMVLDASELPNARIDAIED